MHFRERVEIGHTHLSRIENKRLNCGNNPSDALIHWLAVTLDTAEDELRLLAQQIPEPVKRRVLQRSDAFLAFTACDDATLNRLLSEIGRAEVGT